MPRRKIGCRLHYQTKREIEYGRLATFNGDVDNLRSMLSDIFDDTEHVVFNAQSWDEDNYGAFELNRVAVEYVADYASKRNGVVWEGSDYTWEDVADYFSTVLEETPEKYGCIYFEWF